jgi:ribosomal protein L4
MKTNRIALVCSLGALLLAGGVALAQKPERDISGKRHPNLAAAQRLSQQAYEKIVAAQQANEWDMNGHAQKAKELLDQVNHELKEAAEAANAHK